MEYKPITSSTLLNKITSKDHLFHGKYTLDPYQQCEFNCVYYDSASTTTVYLKTNAPQLLEQDLQNNPKGTIIIGSVHDPYQSAEHQYQLTQQLLQIIKAYDVPCHILT